MLQPLELSATLVNLKKDGIPLKDAMAELETKPGNKVVDLRPKLGQRPTNPELKLDLASMPFLPALDKLAAAAELTVLPIQSERGSLGLGRALPDEKQLAVTYSGPFRISLVQRAGGTRVLELTWEPRLRPILLQGKADSVQASVNGADWQNVYRGGVGAVELTSRQGAELPLRLTPPMGTGRIKELKGQFNVLIPARMQRFAMAGMAVGQVEKEADVTATLQTLQTTPKSWTATVKLLYPPGKFDVESSQFWALETQAQLQHRDRPGEVKLCDDVQVSVQEAGPFLVTYKFNNPAGKPADWNLVVTAPATPVKLPVAFSFKNLP